MKFQHNEVGISFLCYGVGTVMHVNRKVSIPKVCLGNSGKIDGFLSNTRIELDKLFLINNFSQVINYSQI